jgi:phenylpropionate dioxygenase-like ring-hydroxylating dioxygenase large terminal subunit
MLEGDIWPALRNYWHPVALSKDVTTKPQSVRLLGEPFVIYRAGSEVVCLQDLCIHRGTPLSLGWTEGENLVCAYHGWAYNREGVCVRIPSLEAGRPIPQKARVPNYLCEERHGLVWVCIGPPRVPIPECPEFGLEQYKYYLVGPTRWKCSAARAMENFVDLAHFAWVHEGILGDRSHPEVPPVHITCYGEELRYTVEEKPNPMHPVGHRRVYRICRPFTIHQRKEREDGQVEVAFFTVTPHSAGESTNYLWVLRSFELNAEEARERKKLDEFIMQQDQAIVENQRPEELPLDLAAELHLRGPDTVAVEYRRFLAELVS